MYIYNIDSLNAGAGQIVTISIQDTKNRGPRVKLLQESYSADLKTFGAARPPHF